MNQPFRATDGNTLVSVFLTLYLALFSNGCADSPPRNPLPGPAADTAQIQGVPDARVWADGWTFSEEIFNESAAEVRKQYAGIYGKPHNILAISGGGADGAFGAGLLVGWSKSGTRPQFAVVTGISTGALTAPFAFLGEKHDETLRELYTTTQTEEIVKKKNLLSAPFSDSIGENSPLRNMLDKYVTEEVIDDIGRAHEGGRRLFVGTFNLDAGRSVIWNIGAIATSTYGEKEKLIHDVLLASASIPALLPPVLIKVEADGTIYDEMHVDGGTGTQVFAYPASVDWSQRFDKLNIEGVPQIYIVRNAHITPPYEAVEPEILSIAARSISSLIRTQGVGDIYQIYTLCKRDGQGFNLASIPEGFDDESKEAFDPVYMGKLFQLGFDQAAKGYTWKKEPQGYSQVAAD